MKILILNDNPNVRGGADKVALQHYHIFRSRKVKTIYFSEGPSSLFYSLTSIYYDKSYKFFYKNLLNLSVFFKLLIVLKKYKPSVVFLHSWTKHFSPSIFLAFKIFSSDLRLILHDYFLFCPNGGLYNYKLMKQCNLKGGSLSCLISNCDKKSYVVKLFRFVRFKIQQLFLLRMNLTLYFLNNHQKELALNNKKYWKIIPHKNIIPPLRCPKTLIKEKNILYLGRPDPEKGLSSLKQINIPSEYRLTFVGFSQKDFFIKNDSKYYGWMDESSSKFTDILSEAYIGIFPSLWKEADGLSPWTIMSYGKPVISFSGNIFGEFLSADLPELVYESNDELELILIRLLDPIFYVEIKNRINRIYKKEYNNRLLVNRSFFENFN